MRKLYVRYAYTITQLFFEDETFAEEFAQVFLCENNILEKVDSYLHIKGRNKEYLLYVNDVFYGKFTSKAETTNSIAMMLEKEICENLAENIYLFHASGVIYKNSQILFSGLSGSGKTTLSIAFSKHGRYAGDEYTYLDIENGLARQERTPFHLKKGNPLLQSMGYLKKIRTQGTDSSREGYYVSLENTNYCEENCKKTLPIKAIVFPKYQENTVKTVIQKVKISNYPDAILSGIIGKDKPSIMFRKFLNMLIKEKICMICIEYAELEEAVARLKEYLDAER